MQKVLSKGTGARIRLAHYGLLYHSDSVIKMCEGIRCLNLCLLRLDTSAESMKLLSRTEVIIKLIHKDYFVVHSNSLLTDVYLNYI